MRVRNKATVPQREFILLLLKGGKGIEICPRYKCKARSIFNG